MNLSLFVTNIYFECEFLGRYVITNFSESPTKRIDLGTINVKNLNKNNRARLNGSDIFEIPANEIKSFQFEVQNKSLIEAKAKQRYFNLHKKADPTESGTFKYFVSMTAIDPKTNKKLIKKVEIEM